MRTKTVSECGHAMVTITTTAAAATATTTAATATSNNQQPTTTTNKQHHQLIVTTNYFHHCTQQSGLYKVECSVPQGYVLGPKEFITYTEKLAVLIDSYQLGQHLYADDAQLIKRTSINNVVSTIQTLQQCAPFTHGVHPDDFS